jgi:threonine dehydratase
MQLPLVYNIARTERGRYNTRVADPVCPEQIREAAQRIQPIASRTPVLTSRTFDAEASVGAFFKCENLQRGGSFKIRGASNFVFSIERGKLPKGVVAYSSGNHAQAVAIAAEFVGVPATLVMPSDAPRSKVQATRAHGAAIITYDRLHEDREAIGRRISQETGATLVPPYDHPWTIAGQGTTALELLEQAPDLDALIAPVGGGGLLSGCAIIAKSINPRIRIFGAEPADANDTYLSMRAGKRVGIDAPGTLADGLRATRPGELTFPILQRLAEDILLVSEDEIRATVKFLLTRMKILVEPSGAVSAAAVLHRKLPKDIRTAGIILSGGNVDFEVLQSL